MMIQHGGHSGARSRSIPAQVRKSNLSVSQQNRFSAEFKNVCPVFTGNTLDRQLVAQPPQRMQINDNNNAEKNRNLAKSEELQMPVLVPLPIPLLANNQYSPLSYANYIQNTYYYNHWNQNWNQSANCQDRLSSYAGCPSSNHPEPRLETIHSVSALPLELNNEISRTDTAGMDDKPKTEQTDLPTASKKDEAIKTRACKARLEETTLDCKSSPLETSLADSAHYFQPESKPEDLKNQSQDCFNYSIECLANNESAQPATSTAQTETVPHIADQKENSSLMLKSLSSNSFPNNNSFRNSFESDRHNLKFFEKGGARSNEPTYASRPPTDSIQIPKASNTRANKDKKEKGSSKPKSISPRTPLLNAFTDALLSISRTAKGKKLLSDNSQEVASKVAQNKTIKPESPSPQPLKQPTLSTIPVNSSHSSSSSYLFKSMSSNQNNTLNKGLSSSSTQRSSTNMNDVFKSAIYIGEEFLAEDISVQLVENCHQSKKLFIRCFRVEPIANMKNAAYYAKNMINFINDDENIQKELQKEIQLPSNVDLGTLESYLEDGSLFIECKLLPPSSCLPPPSQHIESTIFQNPLFDSKLNHTYSKDYYFNKRDRELINDSSCCMKANDNFKTHLECIKNGGMMSMPKTISKSVRFEESSNSGVTQPPQIQKRHSTTVNRETKQKKGGQVEKRARSSSMNPSPTVSINHHKSRSKPVEEPVETIPSPTKSKHRHHRASHNHHHNQSPHGQVQDGFNCITKDLLDNVYLTYFFKLPSCSPSDRTQVKIENHSILRLKIIQERKFNGNGFQKKSPADSSSGSSTSSSTSTSCESSTSASSLSSFLDSKAEHRGANKTKEKNNNYEESIFYLNNQDEQPESSNNKSNRMMLREFSRSCRLPTNLFVFDETALSVSFINNIWIRVEVPIVEFIDFSSDQFARGVNLAKSGGCSNNTTTNQPSPNNDINKKTKCFVLNCSKKNNTVGGI